MSEQETEELDLDELIITLEYSVANFDEIDTSSLAYQAAQKLKLLQAAFNDGFELAEYESYSEIVGQVQGATDRQ